MFARVTRYKMKPGSRDAATEKMEALKSRIMGMPGMLSFTNVMNEDGTGVIVSLVESEDSSNANAETIKALWSEFSHWLEEAPTPEGYDVVANWSN